MLPGEFQVAFDRTAEQHALLRHIAHQVMQGSLRHLAHVNAVNADGAAGDIVKARDEVEQRRFAAAGRADDGRRLAGLGRKADVLQRVTVGTGVAEADILELDFAVPVFSFHRRFCGSSVGVVDGGRGADDLVDTVRRHTSARQHDRHHRQHQERHDDLHRVGDEGDHLADLHRAQVHGLAAEPDDQQAGAVHDQCHKRHHGGHCAVGEQLGAHQVTVGFVKACFLEFFAAERANRHNAGQDFAADKVQPVNQRLHQFKLGHGKVHQNRDEHQQRRNRGKDDPFQPGIARCHVQNAANAQNGRVRYHAQQDHADELHLLDVVGGAGYQRRGGKPFDFGVGVAHDGGEHLTAQVAADSGRHAGRDEAHGHGCSDHQQGQAQHLPADAQQIGHLHIVRGALGLVLKPNKQHGLTGQIVSHRRVQLRDGGGKLILQHFPRAGGLGHRRELPADGIQVVDAGGHGLGAACGLRGILRSGHVQHHVGRGKSSFQLGHVGVRRKMPQAIHVFHTVPLVDLRGSVLGHQQFQRLQGGVTDGLRHGAFDAALLDADVHNFAGVVRQRQVAVGLHDQQGHHGQARRPMARQLFENFSHWRVLLDLSILHDLAALRDLKGRAFAPVRRFRPQWRPAAHRAGHSSG